MDRHLLLDRSLHALETDAELVLKQFTHRARRVDCQGGRCRPPDTLDGFLRIFKTYDDHFVEVLGGQQRIG